jgi:tetratricopeptide (TPR) repeat protein
MKRAVAIFTICLFGLTLYAPPNCELYNVNSKSYESCQEALIATRFEQGSYESQQHFERSIELNPRFAYSYMQKSIPYLKRGLFIEWKKYIDIAVELSPEEYLGYRGWCRLQFLRDYRGAIADIEKLKSLVSYDIGYCQTGDYHLNIALALCYKEIGELKKAKLLFLEHTNSDYYSPGPYDFYHFGIIEYNDGNFEKALEYLQRQIQFNDYLGETYYYLAMAYKNIGNSNAYNQNLQKAEEYYKNGKFRVETYTEPIDKVYLIDILEESNV